VQPRVVLLHRRHVRLINKHRTIDKIV
jgi:hypothetical protein